MSLPALCSRATVCAAPLLRRWCARPGAPAALSTTSSPSPSRRLPKTGPTLRESIDVVRARDARKQVQREAALESNSASIPAFSEMLRARAPTEPFPFARLASRTAQINLGKLCNIACSHCHVEAGPTRTAENMDARTADRVVDLVRRSVPGIATLDLTGGAPELSPHFRRLVVEGRALGLEVIDRCNLSVLFEPGQEDTARFLAEHGVRIIASLPGTTELKVDRQRGRGSWSKSVQGLALLNSLGYGTDPSLQLDLIYNPDGPQLPGPQAELEVEFRRSLRESHGLSFTRLLTLTNMPVKRFADDLARRKEFEPYMSVLALTFNPAVVEGLMCRSTVSVGWDGQLFDCDFNQQLSKPMLLSSLSPSSSQQAPRPDGTGAGAGAGPGGASASPPLTVWDVEDLHGLRGRPITTHKACYGCTAGAGSSCGGALL
jgi:radical SAM/Cys-rich protein